MTLKLEHGTMATKENGANWKLLVHMYSMCVCVILIHAGSVSFYGENYAHE